MYSARGLVSIPPFVSEHRETLYSGLAGAGEQASLTGGAGRQAAVLGGTAATARVVFVLGAGHHEV